MVFDRGMSLVNMPKHPASRRSSSSVTSSSQGRGGGRGSPRDGQQHQPSPTTATGPDKASPQQLTSTTLPTAGGGEDRSHGVVPKNASLISIDSRLPPEPQSDAIREEGGTAMRPARVSDQKSGSGAGLEGDKPSKGSTRDNSDTRALTKDDSNPSAKLYDAAASPSIPQSNWVDVTAGSRGSRGGGGGGGRSPSRKKGHSVTAASSTCTATAWSVPQGGTGCGAEGSVAGGAGGVKVAGPKTGDGASNDKIQSGQTQEVPDLLLFSAFPPLSAAASTSPPPSSHSTEGDKGISCVTKKDNQGENEDPAVVISAPSDGKAVTASGQNSTDLSGKDEGLVGPCCVGSVAVASPPDAFLVSKIQPPPPPPLSERKRGTSVVVSGVTGGESFSTSYQPESLTTEKADDATRPSSCSPPYPSSPLPLWGQGGAVRGGGTYSYYTDNTNIWATGTRTSENSSTAKQKEQQPHYLHAASSSSSSCATSVSSEAAPCADDVFDEAGDPVAGAALLAPIIVADRRSAFLKTQMCQHVSAGRCRMGEQCRYAHSREELRPAPQLDKTMMCATIKAGKVCPRGSACTFAHSRRELRQTIDHYKTNMCRNWLQGRCSKPNTCNHAHGEQELLFYRRLAATRGCRNFTKEQKHMGQITGSTSLPGGGGGQLLPPPGKGSAQQLSPGQSLQHHSKGGAGVTPFFSVHGQTEFSAQYRQDTAPGPVLTENENTLQRSSGGREEGSSNLPPQSAAIEPFNSDVFPSSTGSAKNVGCCSMVIMARTRDGNMTRLPRRNSFFSQSNDGGPVRDSAVGALSQEAVRGRRVGEEEWGFHPSMIGAEDWRTLHRPGRAEQADESRHETEGSGIRVDLQRSGVDEAFEDERARRFPESVLAHRGMQQPLHADGGESHSGEGGGPYGTGQFEAVGSGEQGFINNGDVIHRQDGQLQQKRPSLAELGDGDRGYGMLMPASLPSPASGSANGNSGSPAPEGESKDTSSRVPVLWSQLSSRPSLPDLESPVSAFSSSFPPSNGLFSSSGSPLALSPTSSLSMASSPINSNASRSGMTQAATVFSPSAPTTAPPSPSTGLQQRSSWCNFSFAAATDNSARCLGKKSFSGTSNGCAAMGNEGQAVGGYPSFTEEGGDCWGSSTWARSSTVNSSTASLFSKSASSDSSVVGGGCAEDWAAPNSKDKTSGLAPIVAGCDSGCAVLESMGDGTGFCPVTAGSSPANAGHGEVGSFYGIAEHSGRSDLLGGGNDNTPPCIGRVVQKAAEAAGVSDARQRAELELHIQCLRRLQEQQSLRSHLFHTASAQSASFCHPIGSLGDGFFPWGCCSSSGERGYNKNGAERERQGLESRGVWPDEGFYNRGNHATGNPIEGGKLLGGVPCSGQASTPVAKCKFGDNGLGGGTANNGTMSSLTELVALLRREAAPGAQTGCGLVIEKRGYPDSEEKRPFLSHSAIPQEQNGGQCFQDGNNDRLQGLRGKYCGGLFLGASEERQGRTGFVLPPSFVFKQSGCQRNGGQQEEREGKGEGETEADEWEEMIKAFLEESGEGGSNTNSSTSVTFTGARNDGQLRKSEPGLGKQVEGLYPHSERPVEGSDEMIPRAPSSPTSALQYSDLVPSLSSPTQA